jgi:ABC-type antimicrobial peptide transport system permease subunit
MSIGAQVLSGALALTMGGAVIGTGASLAAGPMLGSLLFDTPAADPAIYALVFGALLLLTAAASLVPVSRAARVDPTIALREG